MNTDRDTVTLVNGRVITRRQLNRAEMNALDVLGAPLPTERAHPGIGLSVLRQGIKPATGLRPAERLCLWLGAFAIVGAGIVAAVWAF